MESSTTNSSNKLAPFNPSSAPAIQQCLDLIQPGPDDIVYDIGCGDGRCLVEIARRGRCKKVIGIEWDPVLTQRAQARIEQSIVDGEIPETCHIQVIQGDALAYSYQDATAFVLYLTPTGLQKISPILEERYHGHAARIVTNFFQIPGWEATKSVIASDMRVFLYQKVA